MRRWRFLGRSTATSSLPFKEAGLREIAPVFTVDRKFGLILLLSLFLHGGLFVLIWQLRQPHLPVKPPVLIASLRLAAITSAAAPTPVEAPAASRAPLPPQARQSKVPEVQGSAPQVIAAAGPAIASSAPPAPLASPPASVPEAPPAKSAITAPGIAEAASDALASYRRQLTEAFARQHSYPRVAAMRGWEGEVRLRLKVARKGNLLDIALERSSGFEVLDRDALALLEAYGNLPPLPDALESNEISVVVPINYKLKKTT